MPKMYGNLHKPKRDWSAFLRTVKYIAFTCFGLGILYVIFFGPAFRVRKVDVVGAVLSNPSTLADAVPKNGSIWFLPKQTILQNIAANNPSVVNVKILRGIPGTVRLEIAERAPMVVWISQGKTYLVDDQGIAFADATPLLAGQNAALVAKTNTLLHVVDTKNLPVQLGTQIVGLTFVQFTNQLPQLFTQYLPSFQIDHSEVAVTTYDLTVFTKQGMQVVFNTLDDAGVQVRNLTRLVEQNKVDITTSHVDLRIDRWAYVR